MSGHLVLPVSAPIRPRELLEELRAAHQFLVEAAQATVPRLLELSADSWGSAAKRVLVDLREAHRPMRVPKDVTTHSFVEVVNQCATLERLIDALAWIEALREPRGAQVIACNPTTSSLRRTKSAPRDATDHDLVIGGSAGERWTFEVSDVASKKDGNRKELKDLVSLGVCTFGGGKVRKWPRGRCFLVVSSEWAERMARTDRHGLRRGHFHYLAVNGSGPTRIFEVRRGRKIANSSLEEVR